MQINIKLSNSYLREAWNYTKADFELLNNKIEAFSWDTFINDTCTIDQACINFANSFIDFCNKCIRRLKVLIRQNGKLWFNSELKYNIRLRARFRKRYFKTKNRSRSLIIQTSNE